MRQTPQPDVASTTRRSLTLLYHELTADPTPYGYAELVEVFASHLQVYRAVEDTPDSFISRVSFDDGHRSNYELAFPRLEATGQRAHFFITAGWTSNRRESMTWSQVRELHAAGHAIGAHGWSHKLLTHCSAAELQVELGDARKALEDHLGVAVLTMSLPGGRSNASVLQACRSAGYQQIFTSDPRSAAWVDELVGRVNLRAGIDGEQLRALLDPATGALHRLERQARLKALGKQWLGDRLYAQLWALLNRAPADGTE